MQVELRKGRFIRTYVHFPIHGGMLFLLCLVLPLGFFVLWPRVWETTVKWIGRKTWRIMEGQQTRKNAISVSNIFCNVHYHVDRIDLYHANTNINARLGWRSRRCTGPTLRSNLHRIFGFRNSMIFRHCTVVLCSIHCSECRQVRGSSSAYCTAIC